MQTSFAYSTNSEQKAILGTTPRDASQVVVNAFVDTKALKERESNTSGTVTLYPQSTDVTSTWIQPAHPVFVVHANQTGTTARLIGTFNGEGSIQMKITKNNKKLARILLRQGMSLFGMSMHTIRSNQSEYQSSPFGTLVQGRSPTTFHDNTIEVGKWVMADLPPDEKLRATSMRANMTGHSTQGITAEIKAYNPDTFAHMFLEQMRLVVKAENSSNLASLLNPRGSNVVDAMNNAMASEAQSALMTGLLMVNYLMKRGVIPISGNYYGGSPALPVELTERTRVEGDPDEFTRRLFYFMGLSTKKDQVLDASINAKAGRTAFYKELPLDLLEVIYTDGSNRTVEYGVPIDGNKNVIPNSISPARTADNKVDTNSISGEILNHALNHKARAMSAMGNAAHDAKRNVLGRMVKVDKKNMIGEVLVSQHHD
jgi:hypothetical protein